MFLTADGYLLAVSFSFFLSNFALIAACQQTLARGSCREVVKSLSPRKRILGQGGRHDGVSRYILINSETFYGGHLVHQRSIK
jgi:hypothetical protein